MKKIFSVSLICLIILGLFFAVGCSQSKKSVEEAAPSLEKPVETAKPVEAKTFLLGISLTDREESFYQELEDSLRKAAMEKGMEIQVLDARNDSTRQLDGIGKMLSEKLDAIVICPVDTAAADSAVQAANKKNIPIFTLGIPAEKGNTACHIAFNNENGGKRAAEYLAKQLNNRGSVVVLDSMGNASARERIKGFEEELCKYPEMKIVAQADAGIDKNSAEKAVEALFKAHPKVDAFFTVNDEVALGALKAIEAAKRDKIVMVSCGATKEARRVILKDGPLKADVVQLPQDTAVKTIEMVSLYLKDGKGKVPANVTVDMGIIDKEALDKGESIAPPDETPGEMKPGEDLDEDRKQEEETGDKKPVVEKEPENGKIPSVEKKSPETDNAGKTPDEAGMKTPKKQRDRSQGIRTDRKKDRKDEPESPYTPGEVIIVH